MMFNSFSVEDLPVKGKSLLYIVHAAFVFTVGVLLMNFLIAVMSQTVSEVAEQKEVIGAVQVTAIIYAVKVKEYSVLLLR